MRGPCPALLLLPWLGLSLCASQEQLCVQNIIGIEGEDIALHPNVTVSPKCITWKKDRHIVAMPRENFLVNNETMLVLSNGSLMLQNLSWNDSGCYKADIEVKDEIMENYFGLKILAHLEPPSLNCSINDTIQVSCTVPTNLQDLLPSYKWEGFEKDEIIFHNQSFVQLQKNIDLSKTIMCIIIAFNVNVRSSISLNECIWKESPHQTAGRGRIMILVSVFSVVLVLIGNCFYLKKVTAQKEGGNCPDARYCPVPSPEEGNASCKRADANLDSPENLEEKRDEICPPES